MMFQKNTAHFIFILSIIILIIFTFSERALSQSVEQVTINYIEAFSAPEEFGNKVSAYVTVSSSDQLPVTGLSVSNFHVLEDGKEIDLEEISQSSEPMAIVLAIDTSGSMQALDKSGQSSMESAKKAALEFVSMLDENDQVALYSFNNDTMLETDFTTDREALIDSIKALKAKHMAATRLYDTALDAVKKASEIPKGRRAVILLTDGKDEKGDGTCSIHSSNDVIDAATTKTIRVPIYTLGAGPKVDAKELGRMASLTGGRSLLAGSMAELSTFYRTVANQLKNQYVIEYITQAPSGEHSLVIKVSHEGIREQDEKRFWSPPLPVIAAPSVEITNPKPSDEISGIIDIQVSLSPDKGIRKVRYYIDAALQEEVSGMPSEPFRWDTEGLAAGLHVIRVEAVHASGQTGSSELTIKIDAPEPPPQVIEKIVSEERPPVPEVKDPVPKVTAQAPKATVPVPEEARSNLLLIGGLLILILVAVLAGIFIYLKRKNGSKETHVAEHSTKAPVTTTIREPDAPKKPAPSDTDNEATTIDMQASLEPVAKLTILNSSKMDLGAVFRVSGVTKVGRGSDNDIVLPDKSVSRQHAEITYAAGSFFIQDRGSSFGTKVDDQKVTGAGTALHDGAKVQFGETTIMEFTRLVQASETKEEAMDDKTMIYDADD